MKPTYLTHSKLAWASVALIVLGFGWKTVAVFAGLPMWTVPVGYFVALIGSGVLFVGWIWWRARNPEHRP